MKPDQDPGEDHRRVAAIVEFIEIVNCTIRT